MPFRNDSGIQPDLANFDISILYGVSSIDGRMKNYNDQLFTKPATAS
jgi:hypothetical protein